MDEKEKLQQAFEKKLIKEYEKQRDELAAINEKLKELNYHGD